MARLCIISARGGSKRILRKNIKSFLGKPIIAYSIETAIKSNLFDEVMVYTYDLETAKIAKKYGAKVPFLRSDNNSNDFATTFDVIEEVLLEYNALGVTFDYACCLYSCALFVNSLKLNEGFNLMFSEKFDSVFPVMSFGFPIERALKLNKDNKTSFFYPKYSTARSQDLELSYHDAGQFYWMNTEKCLLEKYNNKEHR